MNKPTEYSIQTLKNLSADLSVSPPIPREGILGKSSTDGNYYPIAVLPSGTQEVGFSDLTTTGSLNALNSTVQLDTHGMGSCLAQVSGTWTGKIEFQGAIDGVWNTLSIFQPTGAITRNGIQNDNQNGLYRVVIVSAYTKVRAIMTSYTSGSATVLFNASATVGSSQVWQLNPANLNATVVANSLPLPTGAATSASQDTLNSLIETLQELSQRLAPLGGAMSNTAQLRAVVTGAVTATGGGYITSAQHIANTLTQTNSLQYNPNNTLSIQSNINNVTVT